MGTGRLQSCPELKDTVNILTFCGGKCWKLIKTDHELVLCIVNFLDLCVLLHVHLFVQFHYFRIFQTKHILRTYHP